MTDGTSTPFAPLAAVRVRAIFQHEQFMPCRDVHDRVHISEAESKMNRNDGACAFGDGCFDQRRINAITVRINIHEDRRCASEEDWHRSGGREEVIAVYFAFRGISK